jgi:hypothetical protein
MFRKINIKKHYFSRRNLFLYTLHLLNTKKSSHKYFNKKNI